MSEGLALAAGWLAGGWAVATVNLSMVALSGGRCRFFDILRRRAFKVRRNVEYESPPPLDGSCEQTLRVSHRESVKWDRKRISHESIFAISMELIGMFARRVWLRQHKFDISLSRIDYRSLGSRSRNLPASRYRPPGRHHLWQPHLFFESFSVSRGETNAITLVHANDDCEIQSTRFMQHDSSRPTLGSASFNWTRNYSARLGFPEP